MNGTINSTTTPVRIQGGILSGAGTINSDVLNTGGIVRPGNTFGQLTINGNYTQTAGGTLNINLGQIAPGVFSSVLNLTGLATLDGTVDFTAVSGFTPAAGDDFTFLFFGSDSGQFANVDFTGWTCPTGDTCDVLYGTNSASLDITKGGTTPTPEPSSLLLLGAGLAGLVVFQYRRRVSATAGN